MIIEMNLLEFMGKYPMYKHLIPPFIFEDPYNVPFYVIRFTDDFSLLEIGFPEDDWTLYPSKVTA